MDALEAASSPRPWGCFHPRHRLPIRRRVFPTPVGVFPACGTAAAPADRLPHARGGVSEGMYVVESYTPSSPRPWGCFPRKCKEPDLDGVFPTPVGVFPDLSHRRSGREQSSPRPWGCFQSAHVHRLRSGVFPTPVGVFPRDEFLQQHGGGLPHASGGVSSSTAPATESFWSSPRQWECFCAPHSGRIAKTVFPAPAGVFLTCRPLQHHVTIPVGIRRTCDHRPADTVEDDRSG